MNAMDSLDRKRPHSGSTLDAGPSEHRRLDWAAVIEIEWPAGVQRHPRVLDVVDDLLEEPCAIRLDTEGLRFTCALPPQAEASAKHASRSLAWDVLGVLGLGESALQGCQLVPLPTPDDPDGTPMRAHLRAVPDLEPTQAGG